jgi:hypothetical protein
LWLDFHYFNLGILQTIKNNQKWPKLILETHQKSVGWFHNAYFWESSTLLNFEELTEFK